MNTLKFEIPIPTGYEIGEFDKKTGEGKFNEKPKDIRERIKTFEDVLEYNNILHPYESEYFYGDKDIVAYRRLKLIAKTLNEGWEPDWNNSNERKYFPWFNMKGGFSYYDYDLWISFSYVGSRLCYKSREIAVYAGKQFEDLYKDYFLIA